MSENKIATIREHFAEEVTIDLEDSIRRRLISAFSSVPREDFLFDPPWRINHGKPGRKASFCISNKVEDVYNDFLISLDENNNINNGQPSLWAYILSLFNKWDQQLSIKHIGCGTGYYTAIMSKLSPKSKIYIEECDHALRTKAIRQFGDYPNIQIDQPQPEKFDLLVFSFGISSLQKSYLRMLNDEASIIAPVVDKKGLGKICIMQKQESHLKIERGADCYFVLDRLEGSLSNFLNFPNRIKIPTSGHLAIK